MLTKGFVLVVVALGVLLSVGGSWGIAALASGHTATAPTSSATGIPGKAGTNGKNGADGKSGTDGTSGSDGASGSNGADGAAGARGPAGSRGPVGPAGASGASAPTFSALSAGGLTLSTSTAAFTFSTQTAAVPAGPALVGFSVGLQANYPLPFPVSCSIVDANNPGTVFATTADLMVDVSPASSTFAATQVVDLTSATSLAVQCVADPPIYLPTLTYQELSIYAISFAP